MTGELLAVCAAFAYGLAGVSISRSRATARGDNGLFLSVVLTAVLSGVLWLGWGSSSAQVFLQPEGRQALMIFALAGLIANVIGRQSMYCATVLIGAVRAGLLRRLTPLFALPLAFLLLGQIPASRTLVGGALTLAAVFLYLYRTSPAAPPAPRSGLLLGTLSALAYALAYSFRALGLEHVPDAALGTSVGALVGAAWLLIHALTGKGLRKGWRHLSTDRGPGQWCTGVALALGQLLQFLALKHTTVLSVAVLGTLEVLFSALIILLVTRCEVIAAGRLLAALACAMAGTALLVTG